MLIEIFLRGTTFYNNNQFSRVKILHLMASGINAYKRINFPCEAFQNNTVKCGVNGKVSNKIVDGFHTPVIIPL
jgi:hypothetical protein